MLGPKKNTNNSGGNSGLVLGETQFTAHRGDHGKHAFDAVYEMENTNFSTQFLTILNF